MHLSFAPIWLNSNEPFSNLWFFSEVRLLSCGRDDDSKVRNFSYSPWKSWYLGGELGILLGWVWLLSHKIKPILVHFWLYCPSLASASPFNWSWQRCTQILCQGKKSLQLCLYDDTFKRDLTALWVSVMFHKSIGDTDHHSHTFLHSDLTSFYSTCDTIWTFNGFNAWETSG